MGVASSSCGESRGHRIWVCLGSTSSPSTMRNAVGFGVGGESGEPMSPAHESPGHGAEDQQAGTDHTNHGGWYVEHAQSGQGQDDHDAAAYDTLRDPVRDVGAEERTR